MPDMSSWIGAELSIGTALLLYQLKASERDLFPIDRTGTLTRIRREMGGALSNDKFASVPNNHG
jgi:hypothetical protein